MLHGLDGPEHEHAAREGAPDVVQQPQGAADVGAERSRYDVVRTARALDLAVGDDGREGRPREQGGRRADQYQDGGEDAPGLGGYVREAEEEDYAEDGLDAGEVDAAESAELPLLLR